MADVNFLRFSFSANTSLGYYISGHDGEGLTAACIHTRSGIAQKIPFSMATLDPRGEKNRSFFRRRRTYWRPGCEGLLVAGWLASRHHTCIWVPPACLLIMHRRSVTSHHLLACMEQGARRNARKPWFTCRQLGYMLDLELYSLYNLSQSYTLGQISGVVEEKPGGLFL